MTGVEVTEALSVGDEAWWGGERGVAVVAWKGALAGAEACAEPACRAVEAMAHLRLVHREGNLAPFWHEGAWNAALAACPATEPWCVLAAADRALLVPAFAGGSPDEAVALLQPLLANTSVAAAATARLRLAAARGADVPLAEWPATGNDGMSRAMQATGRAEPPDPGTWTLGLGLTAAPLTGLGGFVRFVDPDFAFRRHRLTLSGWVDSSLQAGGSASFAANLPASPAISLAYSHGTLYRWEYGAAGFAFDRGDAVLSVGHTWAPLSITGGVAGLYAHRGDITVGEENYPRASVLDSLVMLPDPIDPHPRGPKQVVALGPHLSLRVADSKRRYNFSVGGRFLVEPDDADLHLDVTADFRVARPVGKGELAARVSGEVTPMESAWYLLPAIGGTTLLRGLPYGRFRDPVLAALQLELRHPIAGPVEGALFVDSAVCDGPHATVGGGVRLVLPPGRDNVTRIDVGWSPEGLGWGVVLGFGQAF
ncbi:hypothetical protein LBMAG42_17060 [Deltaproteobacteria bacterium]|nr:hypothetical protein LBMAG42_17060 [Deltaproteobacteria bacterium]